MNIGFDAKRLFHNHTGLGNYSRTLVGNLKKQLSEEKLYLYSPPPSNEFCDFQNQDTYRLRTGKGSLWRSFGIKKQLQQDQINIFHGLSNELPFGLNAQGIRSVVTIHDLIFKILPHTYPLIDRSIYDFKFQYACRNATKIIAISESTKNDIIRYYSINPQKIEVIYQACNAIFYSDGSSENLLKKYALPSSYILVVGGLGKRKNLDLLLDAHQLLPRDLQIPIVLVDRGKTKGDIGRKLEKITAKKQLYWIKNLDDTATLQQIYQRASLLVYPSLYEGFGLPIVEALLSKTPVITALNSSLQEAGGKDTIYLQSLAIEEMKTALERVLTDSQQRQTMITKGYEYAHQKFNPLILTQQVADLLRQVT